MKNNERGLKGLLYSFKYAFAGIAHCIKNERNMRIHLTVALYVTVFAFQYGFNTAQKCVLLFAVALVLASEMLNTAIEATIDLVTEKYSQKAKIAKDVAAGAVFVCALFATAIGVIMFWDISKIADLIRFFITHPINLAMLLLSGVCSLVFIFWKNNDVKD